MKETFKNDKNDTIHHYGLKPICSLTNVVTFISFSYQKLIWHFPSCIKALPSIKGGQRLPSLSADCVLPVTAFSTH
jgi:hypothetical protein